MKKEQDNHTSSLSNLLPSLTYCGAHPTRTSWCWIGFSILSVTSSSLCTDAHAACGSSFSGGWGRKRQAHAATQMHINMFCLSHNHMSFISFRHQIKTRRVRKVRKHAAIINLCSHTFFSLSFSLPLWFWVILPCYISLIITEKLRKHFGIRVIPIKTSGSVIFSRQLHFGCLPSILQQR